MGVDVDVARACSGVVAAAAFGSPFNQLTIIAALLLGFFGVGASDTSATKSAPSALIFPICRETGCHCMLSVATISFSAPPSVVDGDSHASTASSVSSTAGCLWCNHSNDGDAATVTMVTDLYLSLACSVCNVCNVQRAACSALVDTVN